MSQDKDPLELRCGTMDAKGLSRGELGLLLKQGLLRSRLRLGQVAQLMQNVGAGSPCLMCLETCCLCPSAQRTQMNTGSSRRCEEALSHETCVVTSLAACPELLTLPGSSSWS